MITFNQEVIRTLYLPYISLPEECKKEVKTLHKFQNDVILPVCSDLNWKAIKEVVEGEFEGITYNDLNPLEIYIVSNFDVTTFDEVVVDICW